jgi:hypothetical protein
VVGVDLAEPRALEQRDQDVHAPIVTEGAEPPNSMFWLT